MFDLIIGISSTHSVHLDVISRRRLLRFLWLCQVSSGEGRLVGFGRKLVGFGGSFLRFFEAMIHRITLPETNSLHLKIWVSQKESHLPTIHFQGRKCLFQGG